MAETELREKESMKRRLEQAESRCENREKEKRRKKQKDRNTAEKQVQRGREGARTLET